MDRDQQQYRRQLQLQQQQRQQQGQPREGGFMLRAQYWAANVPVRYKLFLMTFGGIAGFCSGRSMGDHMNIALGIVGALFGFLAIELAMFLFRAVVLFSIVGAAGWVLWIIFVHLTGQPGAPR